MAGETRPDLIILDVMLPDFDGLEVMRRVRSERDRFVGFVLQGVESIPAADRVVGHARFVSDTVLDVDGHTRITARSVVIATGSSPSYPDAFKAIGDRLIVGRSFYTAVG